MAVVKKIVITFVVVCLIIYSGASYNPSISTHFNSRAKSNSTSRNDLGRFFSMFTVIKFKNDHCTTTSNETGVCYTLPECFLNGGLPGGGCASGYGVCCLTKVGCGGTKSNNCTYLQSPGYPSTFDYDIQCRQSIAIRSDVCSVRLTIDTLDLKPPNEYGKCLDDFLTVNQDRKFQRLCGTTLDNHFYLTVDESSILDFNFVTNGLLYDRRWRIQVCQISCTQETLPPSGCGQYYPEPQGTMKGLNADPTSLTGYYLANLNFAICIRRNLNKCKTSYFETRVFYTICDDSFERPYSSSTKDYFIVCDTLPISESSGVIEFTSNGPDTFYLTTNNLDTNSHISAGLPLNYNIVYEQKDC